MIFLRILLPNPPIYVPSICLSLPFSGDVYCSNCSQHLFVRSTSRGEGWRGVSKPVLRPAQNSFSVRLDILQEIGVKISFTSFSGQTYKKKNNKSYKNCIFSNTMICIKKIIFVILSKNMRILCFLDIWQLKFMFWLSVHTPESAPITWRFPFSHCHPASAPPPVPFNTTSLYFIQNFAGFFLIFCSPMFCYCQNCFWVANVILI